MVEHVGRAFGEEAVALRPHTRRGSRQFNLELAAQRQGDLFQKLERD